MGSPGVVDDGGLPPSWDDDPDLPGHVGKYMSVRLTVIGSSPAWPNPGSAQSGYLVEAVEGRSLLLDCGPGVLGRLRETEPLDVEAIAITHFHLDHWGDLVPWAWLAAYGRGAGRRPELWLPPGGGNQLATFATFWGNPNMFEHAFELREYHPAREFEAAGFRLEAHRVPHYTLEAFGFRVRNDDRLLAYSGDSGPGEELRAIARGADLFLCEATLATPDRDGPPRGHLTAEEALSYADGPILLTHRPYELPLDGREVATDGLVVDV
jgi:ribonuclease BN (tRNA processing enzyme)